MIRFLLSLLLVCFVIRANAQTSEEPLPDTTSSFPKVLGMVTTGLNFNFQRWNITYQDGLNATDQQNLMVTPQIGLNFLFNLSENFSLGTGLNYATYGTSYEIDATERSISNSQTFGFNPDNGFFDSAEEVRIATTEYDLEGILRVNYLSVPLEAVYWFNNNDKDSPVKFGINAGLHVNFALQGYFESGGRITEEATSTLFFPSTNTTVTEEEFPSTEIIPTTGTRLDFDDEGSFLSLSTDGEVTLRQVDYALNLGPSFIFGNRFMVSANLMFGLRNIVPEYTGAEFLEIEGYEADDYQIYNTAFSLKASYLFKVDNNLFAPIK